MRQFTVEETVNELRTILKKAAQKRQVKFTTLCSVTYKVSIFFAIFKIDPLEQTNVRAPRLAPKLALKMASKLSRPQQASRPKVEHGGDTTMESLTNNDVANTNNNNATPIQEQALDSTPVIASPLLDPETIKTILDNESKKVESYLEKIRDAELRIKEHEANLFRIRNERNYLRMKNQEYCERIAKLETQHETKLQDAQQPTRDNGSTTSAGIGNDAPLAVTDNAPRDVNYFKRKRIEEEERVKESTAKIAKYDQIILKFEEQQRMIDQMRMDIESYAKSIN